MGRVVHWKRESYDFYVGRNGSYHGVPEEKDAHLENPFPPTRYGRAECIEMFEEHARARITWDRDYRNRIAQCHDKTLGCWCHPLACHGHVILKLAAELNEQET